MNAQAWALVLGIVAVVLAGVVLFGGFSGLSTTSVVQPEASITVLPDSVQGFELQESLPKVDPIFEGEKYSSLVSFTPEIGSPFARNVSRVGVMLYHFEAPEYVQPALAILSLGNALQEFKFRGKNLLKFVAESSGQVTLFLPASASLIQILAVGPLDVETFELDDIENAALLMMDTILQVQP